MSMSTLAIVILITCVIGAFILITLSFLGFLVPTLGIFGGLGWFVKQRSQQADAMLEDAQTWLATTGEITKSRVQVAGGEYTTVRHHIEYRYKIGDAEYTGTQVKAGDQFQEMYSSKDSYDLVDKYPIGAQVNVFFNPADPSQACLER